VAHEPDDWTEWLASRTAPTEEPAQLAQAGGIDLPGALPVAEGPVAVQAGDDAARGRELFMEVGCAACHRVVGTEATGRAGPDLTHVGSRLTLGAGILPNHRGTLIGWIGDSQSIKPGNRMPSYDLLPAEDLHAIAAWLEQQR
jgi:cytochrome c oxidase subunit 2